MPTEEQLDKSNEKTLYAGYATRVAQRLTISGREVSKLGFWLRKQGTPPGNVLYVFRKVSNDAVIVSEVLKAAASLSTDQTYEEHTFSGPPLINEEVRMFVEYSGGDASNRIYVAYQSSDVKADELYSDYPSGGPWGDNSSRDVTYIYTYEEPAADGGRTAHMAAKMMGARAI